MRRVAAAVLLLGQVLLASGCVVATVAGVVGGVAVATVSTAGSVAATTVKAGGRAVAAAVPSRGPRPPLGADDAARLARPGAVAVVDGADGTVAELRWTEGLRLAAAARAFEPVQFRSARLIRQGRIYPADLEAGNRPAGDWLLRPGDVVELRP